MTREQAERRIRYAWVAGLFSGFVTLVVTLAAATRQGGALNLNGLKFTLWGMLDVFVLFILTFGIYRRSRVAAVLMFIYFLISKLMAFAAMPMLNVSVIIGVVFLYFYFEGARGAIAWHHLLQASHTSEFDKRLIMPSRNLVEKGSWPARTDLDFIGMVKAILLFAIVLVVMTYPFSLLTVHIELLLRGVASISDVTTVFWPFGFIRGMGISWGLAAGAGLGAGAAIFVYQSFVVRRWGWVSEEQYTQLMGRRKS